MIYFLIYLFLEVLVTVQIALPAYIGLSNFLPPSKIAITSVIG